MRRRLLCLFCCLLTGLFLSACSSHSQRLTAAAAATTTQVLYIDVPAVPQQLVPFGSGSQSLVEREVFDLILPQTFFVARGDQLQLNPALLSSAEVIALNPETVSYQLISQVRWSDDVPITLSDFLYTWHTCTSPGGPPFCPVGYKFIKSISSPSPGTVDVVFSEPFSDWESLFNDLLPAHTSTKVPPTNLFSSGSPYFSLSGGPYYLAQFVPSSLIVLKKNSRFWLPNAGPETIIFRSGISISEAAVDIAAGNPEIWEGFAPPQAIPEIQELGGVEQAVVGTDQQLSLVFNTATAGLLDPTLRKALSALINRALLTASTAGLESSPEGSSGNHILSPTSDGYTDNSTDFGIAGILGVRAALTADGFKYTAQGVLETAEATPLSLSLAYDQSDWAAQSVAQDIQSWFELAGITLNLIPEPPGRTCSAAADMYLVPAEVIPFYSYFQLEITYSAPCQEAGPFSAPSALPEVAQVQYGPGGDLLADYYFDQALHELNPATIDQDLQKADQRFWADDYALPLFIEPLTELWPVELRHFMPNGDFSGFTWNAYRWQWLGRY